MWPNINNDGEKKRRGGGGKCTVIVCLQASRKWNLDFETMSPLYNTIQRQTQIIIIYEGHYHTARIWQLLMFVLSGTDDDMRNFFVKKITSQPKKGHTHKHTQKIYIKENEIILDEDENVY